MAYFCVLELVRLHFKSMYYQVRMPKKDSNYLRFLWFPNNDLNQQPKEYRLLVHVFGAKSSPSVANYALQHTASSVEIPVDVKETILKKFYVDDLLCSVHNENSAIDLANAVIKLLQDNGFELTSFVSNSRSLLTSLPSSKLSKNIKELDLVADDLPVEKALGVIWNIQNDSLGFKIKIDDPVFTKRGILSTLFSIYDPLFLVSPVIIVGKKIFQELCESKIGWDQVIDPEIKKRWLDWINDVFNLSLYEIPWCYTENIQESKSIELHVFCDGSLIAYGAVAYLRFENYKNEITSSILMAKSRLTPINRAALRTVPRIELNAAKESVLLYQKIKNELDIKISSSYFWSDSVTVLNYIKSETGRFHRFVENRVSFIRGLTNPNQWFHVPSAENPADLLSRGSKNVVKFMNDSKWKRGPEFLFQNKASWPNQNINCELPEDDVEVKQSSAFATKYDDACDVSPTEKLFFSTSSWMKLVYRVATIRRLSRCLKSKVWINNNFTVSEISSAELAIWKYIQQKNFKDIFIKLSNNSLERKHHLSKLSPFIDGDGVIRVGGRIKNANVEYEQKHPIILPKNNFVVKLFCRNLHGKIGHLGRENLISNLRKNFYIIGCSSLAKEISRQCVICRRVHGRPSQQLMADLPVDRLTSDLPAFSNTGIDFFGPILVSRGRGRAKEKRYGVLFTCLSSRAMHIEIAHSLDTDSFINSLRRFISRRGPVKLIRSDNGTNFVSGNKEINAAIREWNTAQVDNWCKSNYIDWIFNPPLAPHFGGVWEREIRSIKTVLVSLTLEFSNKIIFTDEVLLTLICEIENILNSRPLTSVSTDPNDCEALTPNHLLRLYSGVTFPPGLFDANDVHHRRRWRQIQHMAEVFWHRWRKEYLPLLMLRQKWTKTQRSLKPGDLVLVIDQLLPRNFWCTGRVESVSVGKDGLVRSANVKVCRLKDGKNFRMGTTILQRPISKLILIKTIEELI